MLVEMLGLLIVVEAMMLMCTLQSLNGRVLQVGINSIMMMVVIADALVCTLYSVFEALLI